MFPLGLAVISMLYATVGQAGGTAFLGLMVFAALPPTEMRPTALALNVAVATYSTWVLNRNRVVDWTMLRPLLFSSTPMALGGGLIVLRDYIYRPMTGSLLLLAGAVMALRRDRATDHDRQMPLWGTASVGAIVGLVSGLTGVGGGVFLAPTLIALNWASPKQATALSSPFILVNSAVGLAGVLLAGQVPSLHFGSYTIAALGGSITGTAIGLKWLGQTATRVILAGVLFAAGIQMVLV
ncbi:sulfite exporter TauE/SafE family protein [Bradyrhizobium sp. DASA03076]|uniref:sulfite exporter TauE/SafE family protein n=1 Tax=Bradyrhizobium sp. BLXBL-03 TaxID=3395916 RepID=UPI003F71E0ED